MNCVVNIYIKEKWKGALKGSGRAAALIVFENAEGDCFKKSVMTEVMNDAKNKLHLQIVTKALYVLKKPCSVGIYMTEGAYVKNTIEQGWPERWEKEDWKTAKGKEVKHSDIWKKLLVKLKMHEVGFVDYISSYDDELQQILAEKEN